jgi:hypothetical protein
MMNLSARPRLRLARPALLTALLLLAGAEASAATGTFGVKTMREPLATREVERSLVLPKGWVELDLGYDLKRGIGKWDSDGDKVLWDSARWNYHTARATVRYGIHPKLEMYWTAPFHVARLQNEKLGTDITDASVGDVGFGASYEIWGKEDPRSSWIATLGYKAPTGSENPGTYIGGPLNMSGFVFTTGTPDLSLATSFKHAFGPVFFVVHASWEHRFSGLALYVIEAESFQFQGRIKPGDRGRADLTAAVQAGPVVPHVGFQAEYRMETRLGTTSPGLDPSKHLVPVAGSDGTAGDLVAGVLVNASRGVDVDIHAIVPLFGQDLQFFPIEDIQPTYGFTFGASVEMRY